MGERLSKLKRLVQPGCSKSRCYRKHRHRRPHRRRRRRHFQAVQTRAGLLDDPFAAARPGGHRLSATNPNVALQSLRKIETVEAVLRSCRSL